MNKQLDDVSINSNSEKEASDRDQESATSAAAARPEVRVDDTAAAVCYANFCRVTGTPEELILDFGLNAQPMGGAANVAVSQRLVVNYFTAKRLLQALGLSIQRHEVAFGVLETDVQKRVMPSLRRAAMPG